MSDFSDDDAWQVLVIIFVGLLIIGMYALNIILGG